MTVGRAPIGGLYPRTADIAAVLLILVGSLLILLSLVIASEQPLFLTGAFQMAVGWLVVTAR